MIPSQRFYLLLLLGMAVVPGLAIISNVETSLIFTLIFDGILLLIAIADSWQVKPHLVKITRYPLQRLSIGRDNHVILSIVDATASAELLAEEKCQSGATYIIQL